MPPTCSICRHPNREAIDEQLIASVPYRDIARRWGVSKDALARHKADHLPAMLAKARDAAEVAHADNMLDQLRSLQARTLSLLDQAEDAGKLMIAVTAVREARGNLELLAKLLGELDESPKVNVLIAPEWLAVRAALMAALTPYPDARLAVAQRLAALEGGRAGS